MKRNYLWAASESIQWSVTFVANIITTLIVVLTCERKLTRTTISVVMIATSSNALWMDEGTHLAVNHISNAFVRTHPFLSPQQFLRKYY